MKRTDAVAATTPPAPQLARVIPLRPVIDDRPGPVRAHAHEWVVVADESDDFGRIRAYACLGCAAVRYA